MIKKTDQKHLSVACLLGLAMFICFALPKSKYEGADALTLLHIPFKMTGWISRDLSGQKMIQDAVREYFGHFFVREYTDDLTRKNLTFFVFDANGLHNPEICFSYSGYEVRPLGDRVMDASGRRFEAHTFFMRKKGGGLFVMYWVCVDKKVTNWTRQKIRQLFISVFDQKKKSLMGRLDIPTTEEGIPEAAQFAKEFIRDMSRNLPPEEADILFGLGSNPPAFLENR